MTETVQQLITQLKELNQEQLWTVADIANYLQMGESSVRRSIVSKSDFPYAVRVPYGQSKTQARWFPHEVKDWIARHRAKN